MAESFSSDAWCERCERNFEIAHGASSCESCADLKKQNRHQVCAAHDPNLLCDCKNADRQSNPHEAETFEATPKWECDECGNMHDWEDDAESCCVIDCEHRDSEMEAWGGPYSGSEFWMTCRECGASGKGEFGRIDWKHDDKVLEHEQTAESFAALEGQRIPNLTMEEWDGVSKALGEAGTFHNRIHEGTDGEGGDGTTLVVNKRHGIFGRRNTYVCDSCDNEYSPSQFPDGFRKHQPESFCEYCLDKLDYPEDYDAESFGAETRMGEHSYETTCDCGTKVTWDGNYKTPIEVEGIDWPSPSFDHFEMQLAMKCPNPDCDEYHFCEIESNDIRRPKFNAESFEANGVVGTPSPTFNEGITGQDGPETEPTNATMKSETLEEIEGPTAQATAGGLHSPSSFAMTWEDGSGQSSASIPPNEIAWAEGKDENVVVKAVKTPIGAVFVGTALALLGYSVITGGNLLKDLGDGAKSAVSSAAENRRKGCRNCDKTVRKDSEYSVGQINPVEVEGQTDVHGAEQVSYADPYTGPTAIPEYTNRPSLKMW